MFKTLALVTLAALALNACDGKGNPYANQAPGAPENRDQQNPEQTATTPAERSALVGHGWCENITDQTGTNQERLNFINGQDYDFNMFPIVNGARGAANPAYAQTGTYSIAGSQVTLRPNAGGKVLTFTMRLDPHDPDSQAAKLHLSPAGGGDAAFDPCN
jgi:hypothetical protein